MLKALNLRVVVEQELCVKCKIYEMAESEIRDWKACVHVEIIYIDCHCVYIDCNNILVMLI